MGSGRSAKAGECPRAGARKARKVGQAIWSPKALEDVEAIAEYLARDSVDRGALFATRLPEPTDRLAEFPESGRVIPELGDGSKREIIVAPYRIMYLAAADDVWMTGGVHGARDWPSR